MKNLKKFIKFFVIALIIVASVVTTCVIFFRNLDKIKQKEVAVVSFTSSETKQNFDLNLNKTVTAVKNDNPADTRFDILLSTISNLDNAMNVVATYYVDNGGAVKDNIIATKAEEVNGNMSLAVSMCKEYEIKTTSTYYDEHLGVNDLFDTTSKYIVSYSEFIILLNSNISSVNKNVNVKFALIDSYCRVCIDVFSNKEASEETSTKNWLKLKDTTNIDFYNRYFKFTNSQLVVKDMFSENNNNFISTYNNCDRANFAENIKSLCESISVYSESLTMEQKAAYYFKEVYGV